jgi:serine phosphatase RsbU (regulator of sigma subunit)
LLLAQTQRLDSLEQFLLIHVDHDTVRINILNQAAYRFYTSDLEKTYRYATEADSLSEKLNYKKGKAESIRLLGIYYEEKSDFTKSLEHYQKALQIFTDEGDKTGIANCYNNIGIIHRLMGDSPRSMENFQKALRVYEELGDKTGQANTFNNIGIIFHDQGDLNKALEYYQKSYEIAEELGDRNGMSNSYINIGIVHHDLKNYPKALEYYQKSLTIVEELGDVNGIILNSINNGLMHLLIGNYQEASEFFTRGLTLSREIGSKSLVAWNYYGLGSVSLKQRRINEAYEYSKKAYSLACEIGEIELIKESAEVLSQSSASVGLYKDAYEFQVIFKAMSDSVRNEENTRRTIGLELEYKYEKERELSKMEQEKKEAIHFETLKHQKNISRMFFFAFVMVIVVLVLMYYNFVQKQKTNRLLKSKNNEIEEKNEELTLLNEEIRAQNEHLEKVYSEIMVQKEQIEKSHFQITESINYAKLIQNAVLPHQEMVSILLPEHFILFKPCEIVSGDFYFIKQLRQFTLIAAADCTGHGVPGAFMSMLGIAFLNEIVRHSEIKTSAEVLTELRNKIKQSLQQSGEKGEQRDGMDMAFCAINLETMVMSFAGAHNPCWIFREDGAEQGKKRLIVLDADRTPVGVSTNEIPFTDHTIQLQKGDALYIFTDGFYTQFGGAKKEKYQAKRLQAKLKLLQAHNMPQQKQILEKEFEEWKGDNVQTDDVLLIGVKIQ